MRTTLKLAAAIATAAVSVSAISMPASAECKRFGFLVNDYGKDGPTKDAKQLLEKSIASKMAERGIKDYKIGTKSVKCELFLNFIVFDEHTCTAEATACWGGSDLPKSEHAAKDEDSDSADKKTASDEKPEKHKKSKSKEVAAKSTSDDAAAGSSETEMSDSGKSSASAADAETSKTGASKQAKVEKIESKSNDAKQETKRATASRSSSPEGVADPVKPRIASSASTTSSSRGSAVVTGSVTPTKKKAEVKKSDGADDVGYPTPQAPTENQ